MRFAAFTFAFGCTVSVSGLPVHPVYLDGRSRFQTGDVSSDTSVDLGEAGLDAAGATASVSFGGFAPNDVTATVTHGASPDTGPIPTALAASAFSDIASLVRSGEAPALSDVASLTSLLGPVPTDIASLISGAASGCNPSASAASLNGSNGSSAKFRGPRGALDPVAFAQTNETGFNNNAFNIFPRDNDTLFGNSKTLGLNLSGVPKFNISVHEFGSETAFRRALDWILARSPSSRRSMIAHGVDLDLDLLR